MSMEDQAPAVAAEELLPVFPTGKKGGSFPPIRRLLQMGDSVVSLLCYVGIQWMRLYKSAFRRIWKLLSPLLHYLFSLLRISVITVDTLFFRSLHAFVRELRQLRREIYNVSHHLSKAFSKGTLTFLSVFWYYLLKAFRTHKSLFARVFNVALPVAGIVLLVECVLYWNSAVYALNVRYGEVNLGYVAEEAVYYDALTLAKNRITDYGGDATFTEIPTYTLQRVQNTQLTDVPTLCDKLIETSDNVITLACGVYVNDSFVCSVKNETDIVALLDDILSAYQTGNPLERVEFVEEIERVQGLYPVDTVWEPATLRNLLTSVTDGAVTYTLQKGDTLEEIAGKTGLSLEQLSQNNPALGKTLRAGTQILLSNETRYLQTKVIRTESYQETVQFSTQNVANPLKYEGYQRIKKRGSNGLDQVTAEVTYLNGVEVGRNELARDRMQQPEDAVMEVGSKPLSTLDGSLQVIPTTGRFCWPAIGLNSISSGFGARWGRLHAGLDITGSGAHGKTVVAADYGTVTTATRHSSYGNYVIIDHGDGYETMYAHLSAIDVEVGQTVAAGQKIGAVGNTGNSTGPHLHFEVHINGRAVNPAPYIGL